MDNLWSKIDIDRIVENTLKLVEINDTAGDTRKVAALYADLLREIDLTVETHELVKDNPTLVANLKGNIPGKTLLFNGHLDVIPLRHAPPEIRDGKIYGRGTCDMKGSLACILEVLRVLQESQYEVTGDIVLIANSMHESPGGRGEDLIALVNQVPLQADAAIVMEGATHDCTIAQLGSATFNINIEREGEPSHQLHTPEGTPHPAMVIADVIQALKRANRELEKEWITGIGHASYFIGSVHSGEFYNQMPKVATLEGVRRYSPQQTFAEVEQELCDLMDDIATQHGVSIQLDMKKVRDGYRIDEDAEIVKALVQSVQKVRGIQLPLAGKKLVTDAGILAKDLGVPTVCHGPDHRTAHGEVEYVKMSELELTAHVYLQLIADYIGIYQGGRVRV